MRFNALAKRQGFFLCFYPVFKGKRPAQDCFSADAPVQRMEDQWRSFSARFVAPTSQRISAKAANLSVEDRAAEIMGLKAAEDRGNTADLAAEISFRTDSTRYSGPR